EELDSLTAASGFVDTTGVDTLDFVAMDSLTRDSLRREIAHPRLRLFGLDAFRGRTTQFEPALAGPVDANYQLGPGDVLVLVLTGEVELAHTLEVNREGWVFIPQVGQLYVANL